MRIGPNYFVALVVWFIESSVSSAAGYCVPTRVSSKAACTIASRRKGLQVQRLCFNSEFTPSCPVLFHFVIDLSPVSTNVCVSRPHFGKV